MSAAPARARGDDRALPSRPARVALVLFTSGVFGVLGLLLGGAFAPRALETYPSPHTIPHVAGGTSLRIAMIHDVLHERYSKHGEAWYRERERRCREALAREDEAAPTDRLLDLMDDLASALDRQHRSDEAVEVQRRKLALVERLHGPRPKGIELPPPAKPQDVDDPTARPRTRARFEAMNTRALTAAERAWYRTCANLGTMLIHASFVRAWGGDAAAKALFAEGIEWVKRSIDLNPGAHFGREVWQAVAATFLLKAVDDPTLLTRYDLIGQPLDPDSEDGLYEQVGSQRFRFRKWWRIYRSSQPLLEAWAAGTLDEAGRRQALEPVWDLRADGLRHVGGAAGFVRATGVDLEGGAPYDEPALGIIGMWTFGGGPNPHFALALGGLCERIGQRHTAWNAYARAIGLAQRFWPDEAIRDALVKRCQARQAELERGLGEPHDQLQARHDAELAFGLRYQEERQRFEAERIAAGADLDAPDFFAAFDREFEAEHGPIASPVGDADLRQVRGHGPSPVDAISIGLAAAGLGALLGLRVRARRAG